MKIKQLLYFGLFALWGCGFLFAQPQINEHTIPVRSHNIKDVGFPFAVVPSHEGAFAFLQYWPQDKFHPSENYYLQCLQLNGFAGDWVKAVTDEGQDGMQILGIEQLEKGILVTGRQYISKEKQQHTVGRFFDFEGKASAIEPVILSSYGRKAKNMEDYFFHSPKNKCLLWMGTNDKHYYFSAWTGVGKNIWKKQLEIPHIDKKYKLSSTVVADNGNAFFLLQNQNPSYTQKDTLYPPILVRYDHRVDQFLSDTIWIDSAFTQQIFLNMVSNERLVVAGILGTGDVKSGLSNGEKLGEKAQWNGLFFSAYRIGQELVQDTFSSVEIPEPWLEKYSQSGSNFNDFQLLRKGRTVVLLMEEQFANEGKLYFYDIGVLAFDVEYGDLKWEKIVRKKQRDRGSSRFLSYASGFAKGHLQLVYLTDRGAPGKLMCSSISLKTGKKTDHLLASNEESAYLVFPSHSGMVNKNEMILIGMGDPQKSDYKLIRITF